tara:strand:- start:547 stop:783 length:237 start_codon:yes stop_codon:yes gene_type:complete
MQLRDIKEKLEQSKTDANLSKGALKHLEIDLIDKFGAKTMAEAKSKLKKMISDKDKEQDILETKLDEFKEKYPDVISD